MLNFKNCSVTNVLKFSITSTSILFFSLLGSAQKSKSSEYKKTFKNVTNNTYSNNLISLSEIKPSINWDNYKGGEINTKDTLLSFDNKQLRFAFPTNSSTHRNSYLIYYFSQKTAKCPTLFSLLNFYAPILKENLLANKLTKELQLLPVVLSAFNPHSDNGIGGVGYWHLNYPQAIKYGLIVNNLVDERKDFEKSTKAATAYLADLYKMYNNWELTLTAYSSGVVTLNKLLNRHSSKTYKEIYPYLPVETKDLVQAFVAMNYVYSYDDYGAIALYPVIESDTVLIERKLKFEAINHIIFTKNEDFNFLNPVLIKEIFPSNFIAYFPKGKGKEFTEFKDSIYFYQDSVMNQPKTSTPDFVIPKIGEPYVYTVRSGDFLGLIANRNNVRVSQIQAWNNLNGTMINIGQKLTIYGKNEKVATKKLENSSRKMEVKDQPIEKMSSKKIKVQITKNQQQKSINQKHVTSNQQPVTSNQQPTTLSIYIVKSGDNLWVIAKKYSGVSAKNLMEFNGIDGNLSVGQTIKIPKY